MPLGPKDEMERRALWVSSSDQVGFFATGRICIGISAHCRYRERTDVIQCRRTYIRDAYARLIVGFQSVYPADVYRLPRRRHVATYHSDHRTISQCLVLLVQSAWAGVFSVLPTYECI